MLWNAASVTSSRSRPHTSGPINALSIRPVGAARTASRRRSATRTATASSSTPCARSGRRSAPKPRLLEIATLAKTYHCFTVTGDRFAGGFPPEVFNRTGLTYESAQLPKSDLFNVMLPLLNSGKIVLPKNTRLINQIVSLERQVGRSGKDSISHPPNGHDDVANAVAGAAELAFHRGFDLAQWKAAWG